ncbi:DUF2971 domain-containing protein [Thiobacillus sp.]|uniref:DUF2971 domain-containing protein n=1 Tax=Thiobacillus sp. TaxID=924 RepID=UPI0025D7227D|nr:DUF2971 domain-containing protein [Thiobacillus sp.]
MPDRNEVQQISTPTLVSNLYPPEDATMQSPNRKHDRESFFKYMSAATAAIVLQNRSLRWSSPLLFNDPFDVPRELSFGIVPEDIVQALTRRMANLIEHPPEDTSQLEPKVRLIVEVVKKATSPTLKAELLAGLEESATTHRPTGQSMDDLRTMWRDLIPQFRILCLTESPAHTAMWYHYADKYRGVVLEFLCDDALDSAWLAAKPVAYPSQKPAVYTADGWAQLLTTHNALAIENLLDVLTYTKAPDWSYENEWRITSFKRPSDTGHFTDYTFHSRELKSIYLGPDISSSDREAIISLATRFPVASLWDVSIGIDREFAITAVVG